MKYAFKIIVPLFLLILILIFKSGRERKATEEVQSLEWGLFYEEENRLPVPNLDDESLNPYGAYFHGDLSKKIIYLTFDAGYENGYTAKILDALKNHGAPATFFLVGPYIKENPDLVKRMVKEGHTVGNHTYHHPDMSKKVREEFVKELADTEDCYRQITGQPMPKFYRPPEGKFSTENLKWAQELGYTTVFWSSAYVDWNVNSQPSRETAFKKIGERTFDGAVFLLHSTSKTNADILDEQLTKWEKMGYTFGDISQLVTK